MVDLAQVVDDFAAPGTDGYFQMSQALFTDGRGFGQQNVVSIPVDGPNGPARLEDLEAGPVGQSGQLAIVATGDTGLTLADPGTQALQPILSSGPVSVLAEDGQTEEATLTYGRALGLGKIDTWDLAVVAGSGTALGETQTFVMVVDVSDPMDPKGLGWTALADATVGDILIKDDLALLGGNSQVTVLSLTDPTQPRVTGTLSGVGGRLALTEAGLLYSTARSIFGGDTELGGVRTAALGAITVITKIDPNPVLLDFDRHLAEDVEFTYRAIPPPDGVVSSSLEFLIDGDVVANYDAPLNSQGAGGQALAPAVSQPPDVTLRAQLRVETVDSSAAPRPMPRVMERESFEIHPAVAEAVQYGEVLEITAVHQGLLERRADDPGAALPRLVWRGPGILYPTTQQPSGLYTTHLPLSGLAGGRGPLSLVDDENRLYGQTGDVTLLPGWPVTGNLRAEVTLLPADGRSDVTLILEDVRDGAMAGGPGNIILDDTPVAWQILGDGEGELIGAAESVTSGGRATVRFRAGIDPGTVVVRAALDVPGQDWYRDIAIEVAPLEAEITPTSPTQLVLQVTSAAGPPADGTPVGWITYRGQVEGWIETEGGEALAEWSEWPEEYFRKGARRDRFVYVGATVGRTRANYLLDTAEVAELSPGPLVLVDSDRLLLDSMPPTQTSFMASAAADDPSPTSPVPTQTTARVSGGTPNGTERIVLGTTLHPAVEPIAAYALDSIVDDTLTPDIYGGIDAEVGPDVALDSAHPLHQPGIFQVSPRTSPDDPPSLLIANPEVLALDSEFGVNGWMRLDTVESGQVVLEREGSYGLEVIDDSGSARLEFHVLSGGARRTVQSRVTLEAGVWYQFAAHSRGGRLALAVSGDDVVALGDAVGVADPSLEPLEIGVSMTGHLDEIAIYDFRQSPMVVFANGTTEIDVVLDENGEGTAEVYGRDTFASLYAAIPLGGRAFFAAQTTTEPPFESPDDPFARRLRRVPVRTYVAPGPDERPEGYWSSVRLELGTSVQYCLEGIGTGEGDLISQQTACDLFAGLIPGTEVPFAFRDLFRSAMNFVDGKETSADYVRGGFALIQLALAAVPATRAVGTAYTKARLAIKGTPAELLIAREAAEKVGRIVADPTAQAAESAIVKILASEADDEARDALLYLLDEALVPATTFAAGGGGAVRGILAGPPLSMLASLFPRRLGTRSVKQLAKHLEELDALDDEAGQAFVKALAHRVFKNKALGKEVGDRMIHQIARASEIMRHYDYGTLTLSADALVGMAIFMKGAKSQNRLVNMFFEAKFFLDRTPDETRALMEELFVTVKRTSDALETAPPRIKEVFAASLARGAGTVPILHATVGQWHALSRALPRLSEGTVLALDSSLLNYAGRPDLVIAVEEAGETIFRQFEFTWTTRALEGRKLSQLAENVNKALEKAIDAAGEGATRKGIRDLLRDELSNLIYVFPDDPAAKAILTTQLPAEVAKVLPRGLKSAAESIGIVFEGKLP